MNVRTFAPEDAAKVARIAGASPQSASWPEGSYAKLPETGKLGWVLESEGEIAGFLVGRIAAGEAEILNLAVAPGGRRRGYASRLAGEALREFRAQGVGCVFLEVRKSNRGAIRFYEELGFRVTGRRAAYYGNPPEDAICMALDLVK